MHHSCACQSFARLAMSVSEKNCWSVPEMLLLQYVYYKCSSEHLLVQCVSGFCSMPGCCNQCTSVCQTCAGPIIVSKCARVLVYAGVVPGLL